MAASIILSTLVSILVLIVYELVVWKRDLKPWIDERLVEPVDRKLEACPRVSGRLGDRRRRFSEALVAIFLGVVMNVMLALFWGFIEFIKAINKH
ncbi:hypothetical protein LTR17_018886 [Elasticomyces elasticus]|nr:hypothetical protein LTR17_018886 [Elasticomyces elasticus]